MGLLLPHVFVVNHFQDADIIKEFKRGQVLVRGDVLRQITQVPF